MEKKCVLFRDKVAEQKYEMDAAVNALRRMPTIALLQTIETIVNVLAERGEKIRDFDNKEKTVQQVRMIGKYPYFLCARQKDNPQEYVSELQQLQGKILELMQENKQLSEENARIKAGGKRWKR